MVNRTGQALLAEGFLAVTNGRLMCRQPQQNRRLQSYCIETPKAQDMPLILRDPQSKTEYCIRKHKSQITAAVENVGMLLSVTRLRNVAAPSLSEVQAFANSYGLSKAEIHVLHAVLGSIELRNLAADRGVNLDTVRKQLKSAMSKIEISSQKELFALFERFRFCGS